MKIIKTSQHNAQKGNIGIIAVIVIIAVLLFWQIQHKQSVLLKINKTRAPVAATAPLCAPDNEANPPTVTAFDYECSGDDRCTIVFDGQNGRPLKTKEYVRIKKNIPIPQHAFNGSYCDDSPVPDECQRDVNRHFIEKPNITVNGREYAGYYPDGLQGNISYDFIGSDGSRKNIRIADYKFLYLVHLVAGQNAGTATRNRQYANIAGFDPERPSHNKRYWITDVYVAKDLRDTLPEDILHCRDKTVDFSGPTATPIPRPPYFGAVVVPSQAVSPDRKQLQLQYVTLEEEYLPEQAFDQAWWTPHCKPVIYLYPQKKETVSVKLNPKGFLTETIPAYPKDGWVVTAYPNGSIESGGKTFDYLYYESAIADSETKIPQEGFVKTPDELENFFADILPRLGLSQKEAKEFSDYWRKALPKANYYFIGIMDRPSIDHIEPLTISPQPDSMIRVRLYFKALDAPIIVRTPTIQPVSTRTGFTVVEWGGLVKTDQNHPFTCEQ